MGGFRFMAVVIDGGFRFMVRMGVGFGLWWVLICGIGG